MERGDHVSRIQVNQTDIYKWLLISQLATKNQGCVAKLASPDYGLALTQSGCEAIKFDTVTKHANSN